MNPRLALLAVTLVATSTLAGCMSAEVAPRNFELEPDRIGWHVGEEASFTLTLTTTLGRSDPHYDLELPFSVQEIVFERKGTGFSGTYRTEYGDAVDFRMFVNGTETDRVNMSKANPEVEIRLTVPDDLQNAEYTLELDLFKVGWIKSDSFRVSVPYDG